MNRLLKQQAVPSLVVVLLPAGVFCHIVQAVDVYFLSVDLPCHGIDQAAKNGKGHMLERKGQARLVIARQRCI